MTQLFGIDASRRGAQRLAHELGIELAPHEEREFEDGEFKIRPLISVRHERVAVYQSLSGRHGASVNDKLIRALVLIGALKDAGAEQAVLVAPYLAYARKDQRTKPHDPVSSRYIAQMCEAVGVDEVVTVDVHNPAAFENAFRCRNRNVEAAPVFAEHFRTLAAQAQRVVVVSPDAGGVHRARDFALRLTECAERAVDLAFVGKHRSEGRVSGELFAGDVHDAIVIIFDDMISSGTTIRRAARLCLERGARQVHAAATHGVFTPAAAQALDDSGIASITVTDTVDDVAERVQALTVRVAVLEIASRLAAALR